jgi:hypothetical protein
MLDKNKNNQTSLARIINAMGWGEEVIVTLVMAMTDPCTKTAKMVITTVMAAGIYLLQEATHRETNGTTKGNLEMEGELVAEETKDIESYFNKPLSTCVRWC